MKNIMKAVLTLTLIALTSTAALARDTRNGLPYSADTPPSVQALVHEIDRVYCQTDENDYGYKITAVKNVQGLHDATEVLDGEDDSSWWTITLTDSVASKSRAIEFTVLYSGPEQDSLVYDQSKSFGEHKVILSSAELHTLRVKYLGYK